MDGFIGAAHVRMTGVVIHAEPGQKIVWQMKKGYPPYDYGRVACTPFPVLLHSRNRPRDSADGRLRPESGRPRRALQRNEFHATALLNGRNHHSGHMGVICEIACGFPGMLHLCRCVRIEARGHHFFTALCAPATR
jgi:hypothetical protein